MTARGWALFAGVSIVWGLPYLFIKLVSEELSPGFQAFARLALAALVLIPIAWHAGVLDELRGRVRRLTGVGAATLAIPFLLVAVGEEWIPSSLAGVLIAAQPIFMVALAPKLDPAERGTPIQIIGMIVAIAGVIALLGLDAGTTPLEVVGTLAVLLASCSYAVGMFLIKRWCADMDPVASVTGATAAASLLLLPLGAIGAPHEIPTTDVLLYMLALGVACTSASVLMLFALVAEVGPTRAAIASLVAPLVAVVLGVVVLGEPMGIGLVLTAPLILGGSWLASRGRRIESSLAEVAPATPQAKRT
jgi:drug/metabolite transporter (DMT)-like permease